jgi:nitrite transporter
MYLETVRELGAAAAAKAAFLRRTRPGYLVAAMLAGAYVGMGIALIFAVGAPLAAVASPFQKLVMGASFGIALTLVVVAGAELFTGNTLVMTAGLLVGQATPGQLARVWLWSWTGNLLGSFGLAALIVGSGALAPAAELIEQVAAHKMNLPVAQLVLSGILCNWLVCLALWMATRSRSEAAKCIVVFWCLFAFIACGYEHSVANMTLLSLALLAPHGEAVSWLGLWRNLAWVTLGNTLAGALLVAGAYVAASCHGQGVSSDA